MKQPDMDRDLIRKVVEQVLLRQGLTGEAALAPAETLASAGTGTPTGAAAPRGTLAPAETHASVGALASAETAAPAGAVASAGVVAPIGTAVSAGAVAFAGALASAGAVASAGALAPTETHVSAGAAAPRGAVASAGTAAPAGAVTPPAPADACPGIPAEVSARHVHLTSGAMAALFGPGAALTEKRALSQPGEFLSEQRVRLFGPKGEIGNVAVLGPERRAVQVELSLTDTLILGVKAPLRLSGDLSGAADVYIAGPAGILHAKGAAIVARNHIHLRPRDALIYHVADGDRVQVRVHTERPLVFEDVTIRVSERFMPALHLDFDEANACLLGPDTKAEIIGGSGSPAKNTVPIQAAAQPVLSVRGKPPLITETEAKRLVLKGGGKVTVPKGSIITPSAKDVFLHSGCTVEYV